MIDRPCCGKRKIQAIELAGEALNAAARVTKSYATFVADQFGLPTKKHPNHLVRLHTCRNCEHNTWMTSGQFLSWLGSESAQIITNLDDLTVLPDLPKQEYQEGRKLFCRKCKCFLPAKTMAENEHCPIGKW